MKANFRLLVVLVLAITCEGACTPKALHADELLTRADFNSRSHQWISLTSINEQSGLRRICENFSKSQKVSILIDRRLNPNREIKLRFPVDGSMIEVLELIAQSQNAELRIMGDAFLILSQETAGKLKTLNAIRVSDLKIKKSPARQAVRFEGRQIQKLMNPRAWQWDDLSQPRELVIDAAGKSKLKIENPEMIPHDLWYHGQMPRAHLVEYISFVLAQYDLTFSWKNNQTIRIEKAPASVAIEQEHRIPASQLKALQEKLLIEFPDSKWDKKGSKTVVKGSWELQDRLKKLLQNKTTPHTNRRIAWDKREYTMRVVRKPLREVFNFLIQSGLPIKLDAEKIKALKIDMEQFISFETKGATAKELFEAICKPVKLPYRFAENEIQIGI